MVLGEWAYEYLCRPILEYSGYNPVNTAVYGLLLLILGFGVVLPLLRARGISFDARFGFALLPFILFGSTFRILEDLQLLPRSCNPLEFSFYTLTPGIYLLVFAVTIAALFLSRPLGRILNQEERHVFAGIGWLLAIPMMIIDFSFFVVWDGFLLIVLGAALITGITIWGMEKYRKGFFQDRLNVLALAGQALDGTATVIATNVYQCGEQHFVSSAILSLNGPLFLLVKLALVLLILHYVDKDIQNESTRGFVKVLIAVLGLAPGIRDLFTVGVGTCL